MKDLKEYENLTNLLLEVVRKRPGMFLGQAKISLLNTFLTGYQIALGVNSLENDTYFGENGFNNWFLKLEGKEFSCLQTPFLISVIIMNKKH